jgi:hypothetical protein
MIEIIDNDGVNNAIAIRSIVSMKEVNDKTTFIFLYDGRIITTNESYHSLTLRWTTALKTQAC